MVAINDISEAELPASLQGLGQFNGGTSLSVGSKGPDVTAMQKLLITFGYPLSADGIFGPKSEAAVKAVQAKLGLTQTGKYDAMTRDRLMGVTQSGVVDATAADKQRVASATTPGSPSTRTLTIAPSLPPVQQSSTGVTIAPSGNFLDKLKANYEDLLVKYPKALPVAIVGTGVVVIALVGMAFMRAKPPAPVQVMGLPSGKRKKRKSTKKRKG